VADAAHERIANINKGLKAQIIEPEWRFTNPPPGFGRPHAAFVLIIY
jgi:hypothetical protein